MTDINVKDMFSDDEIKATVKEMLNKKLEEKVGKLVSDMNLGERLERMATNLFNLHCPTDTLFTINLRRNMETLITPIFLEHMTENVKNKIEEIINGLTYDSVFARYDSPGNDYLEEILKNNKKLVLEHLNAKVKDILQSTEDNQYSVEISMKKKS